MSSDLDRILSRLENRLRRKPKKEPDFAADLQSICDRAARRAEAKHRNSVKAQYGFDVRSFSVLGLKRHPLMAVIRKTSRGCEGTCCQLRGVTAVGKNAEAACVAVAAKARSFVEIAERSGVLPEVNAALTLGFQYPA